MKKQKYFLFNTFSEQRGVLNLFWKTLIFILFIRRKSTQQKQEKSKNKQIHSDLHKKNRKRTKKFKSFFTIKEKFSNVIFSL